MTRAQLRQEQVNARYETSAAVLIGGKIDFVSPGKVALCMAPTGEKYAKDERGVMHRLGRPVRGKAARKKAKRARMAARG